MSTPTLDAVVDRVSAVRREVPALRSALVAVTGIDGCGKGFVSARLAAALESAGLRTAIVHVDPWLNLPAVRFDPSNPAEHFYLHAIRFDAMFEQLVRPFRERRSIHCEYDSAEETATTFQRARFDFEDAAVILLEGIYLLKRAYRGEYDLACWIECGFDTALERALARGQEGLPRDETIRAYRTIYFPAQEIHTERDAPRSAASLTIENDA